MDVVGTISNKTLTPLYFSQDLPVTQPQFPLYLFFEASAICFLKSSGI